MDKLTIFSSGTEEVEVKNIDTVVEGLGDIERELILTRKGNETFIYGEEVEDSNEVDLSDVPPKEGE